jgi:hypothetical protein
LDILRDGRPAGNRSAIRNGTNTFFFFHFTACGFGLETTHNTNNNNKKGKEKKKKEESRK